MVRSGKIRIIWKTTCKWRNTDFIVTRKDVRPMGSKGDTASIEYKEGDVVKVKQDHDFHSPDLKHFTSTCKVSDVSTQTDTGIAIDLHGILTECKLLKNKINEVDEKKPALAINMLKVTG